MASPKAPSSLMPTTTTTIPPMYKYLLVVALGCIALHRLTSMSPPPLQHGNGGVVGLGKYHIHDEVAIQDVGGGAVDNGIKDDESRIIVERVKSPDAKCALLASQTGLSDGDLFYLNFDKISPRSSLDPKQALGSWLELGCLSGFFATASVGSGDLSQAEKSWAAKSDALVRVNAQNTAILKEILDAPLDLDIPPPAPLPSQAGAATASEHYDPHFGKHWPDEHPPPILYPDDEDDEVPDSIAIPDDLQAAAAKAGTYQVTPKGQTCPAGVTKCCALEAREHYWGENVREPVVAITTGVTSRGLKSKEMHVGHLALFTKLLPSIVRTYDCDVDYLIVMAFDKGDKFYDTEAGQQEMNQWLDDNMAKPMALAGVRISFLYVQVDNTLKKPGPVFNAMLKEAYIAGADYFYRLNDDTELLVGRGEGEHHWAKAFIGALSSLGPPYGVAGPFHNTGNKRILTHDFVHRVHMDIFRGIYYDPLFTDWWMDDYISFLYGRERTLKSTHYPATHHTSHHGRRYEVGEDKSKKLPGRVKIGREKIAKWMGDHGMDQQLINEFVDDNSGFPYRDFPCGDFTAIPC
ncbi:hypothetical protein TrVE_jg8967 [Triparma verrucosa]|uniref:Uncharacterized protein n=1 Tax=Triparma verrucosa TaxID=1606542 RepID=A0A9W7DRA0_9STRA|nr:hypothetical protein TrVE_jg8967 [Triparma verrucosa]